VILVGGTHPWNGRIEIFHDNQWGTVCNYQFDAVDARVVCRQLGYSGGSVSEEIREGSGQIWLDRVQCNGNELSLSACRHRGWGENLLCVHEDDVSIECGD